MIRIFYRPAEASCEPFAHVASLRDGEDAADEIASWSGPRLHHGDLVRLFRGKDEDLFIFDADASELVEVKSETGAQPWVVFWEKADDVAAARMASSCALVPSARVVLAACECATAAVLRASGVGSPLLGALEVSASWARSRGGAVAARRLVDYVASTRDAASAASASGDHAAREAAMAANSVTRAARAASSGDGIACARYASNAIWSATESIGAAGGFGADIRRRANEEAVSSVRKFVPLSVLACGRVGARDPLPVPPPSGVADKGDG